MSTATLAPPVTPRSSGSDALAGTGTLLRFALRRDRIRLTVWLLAIGLLATSTVSSLQTAYPTAADRQARAELMTNPAAIVLSGPSYGLDDYSLGAMVANESTLWLIFLAAIMSITTVVRHTRTEEETGRAELVRAGVVGRHTQLTAAMVLLVLADTAAAVIVTGGLAGTGLDPADSLAVGVGVGLTGLVFGAVAAVAAQLTEHHRAATGSALAVLGAATLVRGLGDIAGTGGSALSWSSPIAWAQQTRAFVDLRWWPLLASLALVVAATALAYLLAGRRDLGAGLVPPRRGPAAASGLLSGPTGLAARLQRGALLGWSAGLLVTGLAFGTLADAVGAALAENPQLERFIGAGGAASLTDAFLATTLTYVGLLSAAFAVTSVLRHRAEETAGRTEALLACSLGRTRHLGGGLLVSLAGAVLLLLVGGLGMGVTAAAVTGDGALVVEVLVGALVHLPAVLLVAGVAVAALGLAPRLTALAWVVLGYAVLAGVLGGLLGLPDRALRFSPFDWVPAVPAEPVDVAPLAAMTVLAAVLVAAGLAGFRRRDLATA